MPALVTGTAATGQHISQAGSSRAQHKLLKYHSPMYHLQITCSIFFSYS